MTTTTEGASSIFHLIVAPREAALGDAASPQRAGDWEAGRRFSVGAGDCGAVLRLLQLRREVAPFELLVPTSPD